MEKWRAYCEARELQYQRALDTLEAQNKHLGDLAISLTVEVSESQKDLRAAQYEIRDLEWIITTIALSNQDYRPIKELKKAYGSGYQSEVGGYLVNFTPLLS